MLLLLFATCSAVRFPRRKLSQALFETFAVLCVVLVLLIGFRQASPLLASEWRLPHEEWPPRRTALLAQPARADGAENEAASPVVSA
jgi:hypothetical protein